jgi:hypothetical protein
MKPTTEATELFRNADGKFAAITYAAGPRGHTVSIHGLPEPYRTRTLNVEVARVAFGIARLTLRTKGFERCKPEVRVY